MDNIMSDMSADKMPSEKTEDVSKAKLSGIILVDKPYGWTSFDVVAKLRGMLRRLTGDKKIKVGHAGTLDPMATGVLPVFVGKATKTIDSYRVTPKSYIADFKLGIRTKTLDITGVVVSQAENFEISPALMKESAAVFVGEVIQLPPMYSAVKVNGRKLYELARKGVGESEIERKPRLVTIHKLEILEFDGVCGKLEAQCSSGTYVRTLIDDIGEKLGTHAVLTQLVRTETCGFKIDECHGIDYIQEKINDGGLEDILL